MKGNRMIHRFRPLRAVAAIALLISLILQGTWVLAGTTGAISGTVADQSTHKPLVGVKVTVSSPSQNASTTSDTSGHFVFLSLAPDSYTVSAELTGYEPVSQSGLTVQADQTQTLTLSLNPALKVVGRVTTRSAASLVKPGTTADVYSIDATVQDKVAALGGGGGLSSAWSALTTVPGVFIAPGQSGYIGAGSGVSIRGGDYDQIGYELDGVPVNRAFDNYPSGPLSSLGQQQVEVYTGAAPANAEAQGISGYINQVIKTGTYPGFATATVAIGGPTYYHKLSFEVGGASPNHNFSYYIAAGGYNQDFRIADQFNGSGLSGLYGSPIAPCTYPTPATSCYTNGVPNNDTGPGSFVLGPYNLFTPSTLTSRDNVVNLHFGIPHKNGTKDDIQLLFVNDSLKTEYYSSTNDQGGADYLNNVGLGQPFYIDGYQYAGATGVPLPANYQALTSTYYFPQSNGPTRGFDANIPVNARDSFVNNQSIFKVQYAKSLGTNALLKVYGYTYYSNWMELGPQSTYADYLGAVSGDYELSSHTRGISATLTDQLNPTNLLSLQGSYTTANTTRDNNTQYINGLYGPDTVNARTVLAALVDSSNPTNGLCYTAAGLATTCNFKGGAQFATLAQAANGTIAPATGTCGGGPCEYLVLADGQYATYNTVTPKFTSFSLTDQWRPTSKLTVDAGVRNDQFQYVGSDTTGTPARAFWYTAFNQDTCLDANNQLKDKVVNLGLAVTDPCPAGYTAANFTNPSGNVTESYNVLQPRLGVTYTLDPNTVLRASYGRYAQPANSAFEQYNALQQNAPALLYSTYGFQNFGFTSPNHTVVPPTSNNFDLSYEHQFKNDLAVKVSPFLRKTQNQIQQFYLNQQTNFVSGLNVGNQTSQGIELEVDKGNFNRNGIAAKASFTYTNSYIRYTQLSNGSTIIDPFNVAIKSYNAYTSYCSTHPTDSKCGTTSTGVVAAPCYTTAGVADPTCAAGSVANPYWNAPVQGLMDVNGNYPTYDIFPAGIGSSVAGYGAPYVGTLVLQYKHDKLAITPALQFFAGQRYGAPESTLGIDPATCTAALGTAATGDPRYNYGAAGGSGFDYASCGTLTGGIPDVYTGKFDTLGAFIAPSQLQLHLQVSYDVSSKVQLQATFANLVNTCFGGTKTGFTQTGACAYGVLAGGTTGAVGNTYNPGNAIQPYVQAPYDPAYATAPLSIYLQAKIKL